MARQRLGVVLLVPQPLATQIDGLRRAMGDGSLGRIPPHVTLVPPVNVPERDLPDAFAVVRRAAAPLAPLELRIGPAASFHPVNPVAYLAVSGAAEQLGALTSLRDSCLSGPLNRPQEHDFVPHVTIADEMAPPRLEAMGAVLADFGAEVTVDRVHVLAEQPGRVWVPIADMPLGVEPAVVGRGGLPLELAVTGRPDLEAASLLAIDGDSPGLPFCVSARRDGTVTAAAWGWTAAGHLEVADLVVAAAHRGQGIGRHVLVAIESLGRRRSCSRAGMVAPREGAAASLLHSCGWVLAGVGADQGPSERGRWERALAVEDEIDP